MYIRYPEKESTMAYATTKEIAQYRNSHGSNSFMVSVQNSTSKRQDDIIADNIGHAYDLAKSFARFCDYVEIFRMYHDGSIETVKGPYVGDTSLRLEAD